MVSTTSQRRFLIPTGEDIRALRVEKGLSQAELAKKASTPKEKFSQPLVARIENGTVNPPISKVRRLLEILYEDYNNQVITAMDLAVQDVIMIKEQDSIANAIATMGTKGVSQLPVKESNGNIIGCVTEKKLTEYMIVEGKDALSFPVSSIIEAPLPEISVQASITEIQDQLLNGPALIVKEGNKIFGILTKTDLLRFFNETGK